MEKRDIQNGLKTFSVENLDFGQATSSKSSEDKGSFKFVELYRKTQAKRSVIKYGKYNDHPQFLKELVELSSMHRSLVETKANLTMGDGVLFTAQNETIPKKALDFLKDTGLLAMRQGISLDLSTFGGFSAQLAYTDDVTADRVNNGTRDLEMAHKHDFEEFRLLVPQKNQYGIWKATYGAVHPNWGKRARMTEAVILPLWFAETKSDGTQTLDAKDFKLDKDIFGAKTEKELVQYQDRFYYYDRVFTNLTKFYPVPDYQTRAAINAIILDGELIEFDVNELRNNLTTGYIVTFLRKDWSNEDATKEAKIRSAERDLVRNDMTGAANNGRVTIVRAEPPANGEKAKEAFTVNEIPNTNTADRHNILESRKNTYILVAHGIIAPEIAGIPNSVKSGFSSDADRIVDAIANLFFTRLNKNREVIKKFYLTMVKEAGFEVDDMQFVDNIPFRKKIETGLLKHAFLINEVRKMHGHEPLSDEERQVLQDEINLTPTGTPSTTGEQTALEFND